MDYKEKYNEALERAEKIYNSEFKPDDAMVLAKHLSMIFPELKESEDEKIKKAIIGYIDHGQHYGVSNANMIAWLEKQKEFVSADFDDVWKTADCDELTAPLEKYSKDAIKKMCHAWYDKGIELERRNWLEKQEDFKQ